MPGNVRARQCNRVLPVSDIPVPEHGEFGCGTILIYGSNRSYEPVFRPGTSVKQIKKLCFAPAAKRTDGPNRKRRTMTPRQHQAGFPVVLLRIENFKAHSLKELFPVR